jgi:putative FmdB family regulatory protein
LPGASRQLHIPPSAHRPMSSIAGVAQPITPTEEARAPGGKMDSRLTANHIIMTGGAMPVYIFRCQKCGQVVEVEHSFNQPHPKKHKNCGGRLHRQFAPPYIIYKGSGFYSTDKRLDAKPEDAE